MHKTFIILALLFATLWRQTAARGDETSDLVHLIAEQNRANHAILDSFDANYTISAQRLNEIGQSEHVIDKSGRIAFAGNRLFLAEQFKTPGNDTIFVRNGNQARLADAQVPRRVLIGKADNMRVQKGTPDPWEIFNSGMSLKLDALSAQEGIVTGAKRMTIDGKPMIEVTLEDPPPTAPGAIQTRTVISYSVNDGYMPLRMDVAQILASSTEKAPYSAHAKSEDLQKYTVNGHFIYLPVKYQYEEFFGQKSVYQLTYQVDEKSVKLNSQLPDDLFLLPLRPDDRVINVDLNVALVVPNERSLANLEAEALSGNHISANALSNPKSVNTNPAVINKNEIPVKVIGSTINGSSGSNIGLWSLGGLVAIILLTVVVMKLRAAQRGQIGK